VVYYLRVILIDSKPAIWRDILVPNDITLDVLHYVIQAVMGWHNNHSHQFIIGNLFYSDDTANIISHENGFATHENSFAANEEDEYDRNEKKYSLSQLLTKEKTSIIYEYDLGDSWVHKIELKKILPADTDTDAYQPRCLNGAQACPPEDCGGMWGYTDMLEAIQHAKNTEQDEAETWFNDDFNPDHFDVDAVNKILRHLFPRR
jgi:hypothetical protein